ncbi:hypothetical protein L2E82_45141 [Cichorium intybus]|uniref:Uncharacterized protein n=1 Tax=Cichorium intybus TaxID=13427 RepID=A0ACB8ZT46_CICIN|nr:hypothetical protein L2E82_45141 [Cichorium intybus]
MLQNQSYNNHFATFSNLLHKVPKGLSLSNLCAVDAKSLVLSLRTPIPLRFCSLLLGFSIRLLWIISV